MFTGQYECTLDWRKSFVIPAKYFATLMEQSFGTFGKRSLHFMGSDTIYIYSEEDLPAIRKCNLSDMAHHLYR